MAVVIEKFLICDKQMSPNCSENFGVDIRPNLDINELRKAAKVNGWICRYDKMGRFKRLDDICPACQKAMERKANGERRMV